MENWSDDSFAGYLAAMIDGEGSIEITGECSVRVRIANTIRPTLDAMRERLGFGKIYEYNRGRPANWKILFVLEVSNAIDMRALFAICGDFIHMKRDQMAAAAAILERIHAAVEFRDQRNRAIMAEVKKKRRQIDIAAEFGVSPQLVSRIKSGHTWQSVINGHRDRALLKKFPQGSDQSFRLHGAPQ